MLIGYIVGLGKDTYQYVKDWSTYNSIAYVGNNGEVLLADENTLERVCLMVDPKDKFKAKKKQWKDRTSSKSKKRFNNDGRLRTKRCGSRKKKK